MAAQSSSHSRAYQPHPVLAADSCPPEAGHPRHQQILAEVGRGQVVLPRLDATQQRPRHLQAHTGGAPKRGEGMSAKAATPGAAAAHAAGREPIGAGRTSLMQAVGLLLLAIMPILSLCLCQRRQRLLRWLAWSGE